MFYSYYKTKSILLSTSILFLTACGGSSSGGDSNSGGSTSINQTGSVTISGTMQRGEVLTATVTDGDGTSVSVMSYQLRRNGAAIAGVTNATWTAVESDEIGRATCKERERSEVDG